MSRLSRRGFVHICATGAVGALLQACESRPLRGRGSGLAEQPRRITTFITANEDFYVIAVDPEFDPGVTIETVHDNWSLELVSNDGEKRSLSHAELDRLAVHSVHYTFECIGNPPGGPLIGNASWRVLPLAPLLKSVGSRGPTPRAVMFEGLDGFYSSVSLERATDDYAFIALDMNGVPLPSEHGFPARVILPDMYGKKQPRWLKRITLLDDAETTSYWEDRHWRPGPVKTTSRIDPIPEEIASGSSLALTGMAFAGARGIAGVEISLDGQRTWRPCRLTTPEREHVWTLWTYTWPSPPRGRYEIAVRAMDQTGEMQIARQTSAFPDGATGLHALFTAVI